MTIIETAAELLDMVVKAEIIHDETIAEAIARAERAETALRTALDSKEVFRVGWEEAEAECRRVIAAIPWRALASIYAHPGIVLDADADAIGQFLDQYADEWAGGFAPSDNDLLSPGGNDERD